MKPDETPTAPKGRPLISYVQDFIAKQEIPQGFRHNSALFEQELRNACLPRERQEVKDGEMPPTVFAFMGLPVMVDPELPNGTVEIEYVQGGRKMRKVLYAPAVPPKQYKNPVCRGAWALGNNCGTCERCIDTKPV